MPMQQTTHFDLPCGRQTTFLFMFDSPSGALRPPMSGGIEREIATENSRGATAVDFSRRITTMVSASVGKKRSQIPSGNTRPACKTVHRNEDGEDQVNGIDTT